MSRILSPALVIISKACFIDMYVYGCVHTHAIVHVWRFKDKYLIVSL